MKVRDWVERAEIAGWARPYDDPGALANALTDGLQVLSDRSWKRIRAAVVRGQLGRGRELRHMKRTQGSRRSA